MDAPWLPDAIGFDWDEGNRGKNWERHRVSEAECEEVFFDRPLLVSDDLAHSGAESRFLALGRTRTGRRLFVSFTIRESLVRVISARGMSRKERIRYEQALEAASQGGPEVS